MHQNVSVACWVRAGADLTTTDGLDRTGLCFLLGQGTVLSSCRIGERKTDKRKARWHGCITVDTTVR